MVARHDLSTGRGTPLPQGLPNLIEIDVFPDASSTSLIIPSHLRQRLSGNHDMSSNHDMCSNQYVLANENYAITVVLVTTINAAHEWYNVCHPTARYQCKDSAILKRLRSV